MFSKPLRVTPAMGVALVALAFAVSGTSLAQGAASKIHKLISGSTIKRGSIPGNRLTKGGVAADRIKSNSLTGKQINESTLAPVPNAANADKAQTAATSTNAQRATNADNALALGGVAAAGYRTFATRAIPSGVTVTGAFGFSSNVAGGTTHDVRDVVQLPGLAPSDLTDAVINFAGGDGALDADASCSGAPLAPTAPAGKVCLYLTTSDGVGSTYEGIAIPSLLGSRAGFAVHVASLTSATGVFGTWAYTAP